MRVFISWSGQTSNALAEAFRTWLPAVIQAVRPYYSPDDIAKGARWSGEIAKILDESRVGLICLTRDNLDAPWIMFEAGALSKNLDRSKVTPVLFGVEPTDLTGPLVQFQAAKFEKGDMKRVVRMINAELGDAKLASDVLDTVFDMWWPKLDERVQKILATSVPPDGAGAVRSQRDILEEILILSRSAAKRGRTDGIHPQAIADLVDGYVQLINEACQQGASGALKESIEKITNPVRHLVMRSRTASNPSYLAPLIEKLDSADKLLEGLTVTSPEDDDDGLPF